MDEKLIVMLKYLRLSNLLANWDEYLKLAGKRNFSTVRLLKYVIEEEYKTKKENFRITKIKRSNLHEKLVIETFPFKKQPKLDKKKILAVYDSLSYMNNKENVIWIGPTGSGKTGLASSFLIHAINNGYTGYCIEFPELTDILYKSLADHSEQKVIKKYFSYDCLLIDEIGYIETNPVQVGLFFTLMHKRHRKKTTLITSNLGFGEWGTFLKNDHLTAALIDRLTENSHLINMSNCRSIRPKLK